jgi:hypothetical protein
MEMTKEADSIGWLLLICGAWSACVDKEPVYAASMPLSLA